ncbi:uncharacterized protein LOC142177285 [Nicotiana tabacum]|uniref:Uncharacterized protein LOC142177285 n=1 Tax=Nicotiana tabacum TaxID=4097 RepID=A0AC58TXC1_TOBAC
MTDEEFAVIDKRAKAVASGVVQLGNNVTCNVIGKGTIRFRMHDDVPLDDTSKTFQLARGFGAKYKDFRTAMLAKAPYPTYNQFAVSLQSHEQMMINESEEKDHLQPHHEHTFVGQRVRGRHRGGGRFNSRGRGFAPAARHGNYSARPNFNDKISYQPKVNNYSVDPRQQKKEQVIICQICGKTNHSALECWNWFDHSFQPEDQLPKALAAMKLEHEDSSLYAYSRATTHILNNPGKLAKTTSYKGNESIFVGNGDSLPISHIGEGKLKTTESKFS